MLVWLMILCLHGVISFLPGILDQVKFTNALVGHSHLAMAGFTTSFVIFLLQQILSPQESDVFEDRFAYWGWHLATLTYLVLMTGVGIFEVIDLSFTVDGGWIKKSLYLGRFVVGIPMLVVSLYWWKRLNDLVLKS
jgi:cytochrome c oxidase cbb3-type subunit 1